MTQEEILGNKLIAEFMGYIPNSEGEYNIEDHYYLPYDAISSIYEICKYKPENMGYHDSWGWLMPPVNKALNILHEKMLNEWEESFCDSFLSGDISLLYDELVDFIKWYNTLQ
jgi:hypothetical protein